MLRYPIVIWLVIFSPVTGRLAFAADTDTPVAKGASVAAWTLDQRFAPPWWQRITT